MSDARINFDTEVLRRFCRFIWAALPAAGSNTSYGGRRASRAPRALSHSGHRLDCSQWSDTLGGYRVDLRDAPITDEQTAEP